MSQEKDRLRPPKAGQAISSRYLHQEHRRARRNAVVVAPPLFAKQTDAGVSIGLKLPTMRVAVTTSTITAATYSGTSITAFGSGTAQLHDATATGAGPSADKEVDVKQIGTSTIASGTTILVYPLYGEALGDFVLGKVC